MFLLLATPGPAVAQLKKVPFMIGNYKVVNTLRVSRQEFEFSIEADITNLGADAPRVVGTVTSTSLDTAIVVRTLAFGDVPAGTTKTSLGTFAIRQNRLVAFNPSVLRWQFTVNSQEFKVAIASPLDGMLANTSVVHVTGTTSSPATTVNVNLTPAVVTGNSFSADVPLTEGANTLTAVATNPLGLVATTSVNVSRDTEKPRVGINAPLENSVTTKSSVTVTGIFSDTVIGTVNSEQGTVVVNGVPALVANRTFIASNVPLTPGLNTLTVTGTDRAGNVGTATTTLTYEAGMVSRIQAFSGDNQSAVIGALLAQPLVVLVTDEQGAPVPNTEVIFKVTQNDGELTGGGRTARSIIVNTDGAGKAQASFQLGSRVGVGNNEVQATAVGFQGPAVFIASSAPAPAGLIVLDSGNRQAGVPNQPLPKPFVAIVVDAGYNRLANTPVIFSVIKGNGTLGGLPVRTVMTDSDGRALVTLKLGPDEGVENNVIEATFPGSSRPPVAFLASGVLPGDAMQTSISGVVLDNSDVPVPGATITVVGTGLTAQSDAQGLFMLKPAPVGTVRLVVDGTTVLRPGSWVTLDYTLTTVAGHDNTIGMPVRLLQIDTSTAVGVGLNYGGTITLPEYPGFSLTLAPGSVTFPGGSKVGSVTATVVHLDKTPEVPNFGQQPRFIISINPKQCLFNPPAKLCLPNVDGLQPGQKTEMYSFDTDLASFVAIGTGTVSSDGMQICSDPGVGVIKGGWHCGGNPSVSGNAGTCPPCQKCEGNGCVADPGKNGQMPPDNKCVTCKNGAQVPITLQPGHEASITASMPNETIGKVNDELKKLKKIGINVAFTAPDNITLTGNEEQCCDPKMGLGMKRELSGNADLGSLTIEGKLWPPGPIPQFGPKKVDFKGFASVEIEGELDVGVFIGGTIGASGQVGFRRECPSQASPDGKSCFFGTLRARLTPRLSARAGGSLQVTTNCFICDEFKFAASASILFGDLTLPINIAQIGYNLKDCNEGLSGGILSVQPLSAKVGVKFSGSYETGGAKSQVDYSADFLSIEVSSEDPYVTIKTIF
ncbi:carboxypeptidase regulatory-like domain-containing protein [Brevifollis gellanilyticus]|uniref:Big-1 domain-containing protein n=1 Tax=Brevifollis gellanilyticus TaxID=748831 RepID=A0A512M5Q6_9BACT|nr:carboxypeptidase regulatory-like domain-containing protein [Brevifollis gellanilyticus]GEP42062.1 hypothetical protein BGE01nite_13530 [Brevifollis gellanilyticus]